MTKKQNAQLGEMGSHNRVSLVEERRVVSK